MYKLTFLRRYGPILIAAVVAMLFLAALLLASSAQSAGGRANAAVGPSAHPLPESIDSIPTAVPGTAPDRTRVAETVRSAPIMFIENVGQFDAGARFQVWGGPGTMWLAEDAIWITVVERSHIDTLERLNVERANVQRTNVEREDEPLRGVNLKLAFPGANPHPRIEPFDRLDIVVSYFIGNDSAQWHPNVPVWGGVRYKDLYPGIDLELTGKGGQWQQRIVARPGADPSAVRLRVEGADALILDGDLLCLTTSMGEFSLPLLQAVTADGSPLPTSVEGPEVRANEITAPFAAGNPAAVGDSPAAVGTTGATDLAYATFLGGSDSDWASALAIDGFGAAYVAGNTWSADFPITAGAFDTSYIDPGDAFVVKLAPDGRGLAYATFLGGSFDDRAEALAVDGSGAAYVAGSTISPDFPTTHAFDTSPNGGYDAFVVKLAPDGSNLAYATFLGGSNWDQAEALAVDGAGTAYVAGITESADFPATPGAFDPSYNGGNDAFVAKVAPDGGRLVYATFLGGSGWNGAYALAVDGAGAAYVAGDTQSSDFPTTPGAFDTSFNGYGDAFVVKLAPDGGRLAYGTFLGGRDRDPAYALAVDGAGAAYVAGWTESTDFPTTPGAFDTIRDGYYDTFVVKLAPDGSDLAYATFLGGSYMDEAYALAVDGAGTAHVAGRTESPDFPTTPGAFDTSHGGGRCLMGRPCPDAFLVKLAPDGNNLAYATFLGGSDYDGASALAVDGVGAAYVAGSTDSADFPATPGVFDPSYNGEGDAFVAKLVEADLVTAEGYLREAGPSICSLPYFLEQCDGTQGPYVAGEGLESYVDQYVRVTGYMDTAPPGCDYIRATHAEALPSPCPRAPSKIIFVSDRDGNDEIYVINADGANLRRLTYTTAWERGPIWSPDSTRIAFSSNRDSNWEIYVMNADGSNVTRLTNDPHNDLRPAWSPDGTQICFDSNRTGNAEIYVMNSNGSDQRPVTNTPYYNEGECDWSPDGTAITYRRDDVGMTTTEIWMMNSDGSDQHFFYNQGVQPAWSPGGDRIAFTGAGGHPNPNYANEVMAINIDGSGERRLTHNSVYDDWAAWSPDGSMIAFVQRQPQEDNPACPPECWGDIMIMDSSAGDDLSLTRLTNGWIIPPDADRISWTGGPQCSIDPYEPNDTFDDAHPIEPGTTYQGYICPSGDNDIYKVTVAGRGRVQLASVPADYDLHVFYEGSDSPFCSSVAGGTSDEQCEFQVSSTTTLYILVEGYSGAWNGDDPYDLRVCQVSTNGLNTCDLQKGDIVIMNASDLLYIFERALYGGYWGHTGIYYGDGQIVESYSSWYWPVDTPGVVRRPISESGFWRAKDWVILRLKEKYNHGKGYEATEYAKDRVGSPYNWDFPDKYNTGSFYCTQLVWRSYNIGANPIDLDSNASACKRLKPWCEAAVTPTDVFYSNYLGLVAHAGEFNRAAFYLASPAHLYITDPQGRHAGVDPATGQIVNEIPDVFYSGPDADPEFVSILNMDGTWSVKVVGTETGSYVLATEVVNLDNHQIQTITGETSVGSITEYRATYPSAPDSPIIPEPAPTGTVMGKVLLQGRSNHSGAVVAADGYLESTTSTGHFAMGVPQGTYTVTATMAGYLAAQKSDLSVEPGQTVSLPDVTLLGGDANNDGGINIFDLVIVGASYRSSPLGDPRADINGDNQVDIFDLVLVGGNYRREAPTPWSSSTVSAQSATIDQLATTEPLSVHLVALQEPASPDLLTVEVRIDNARNLYGAHVLLKFDPTSLAVQDADPIHPGVQIAPGELLAPARGYVVRNSVDEETGIMTYALTLLDPALPAEGDGVLARITFKRLNSNRTAIRLREMQLADRSTTQITARIVNDAVNLEPLSRLYLPFIIFAPILETA